MVATVSGTIHRHTMAGTVNGTIHWHTMAGTVNGTIHWHTMAGTVNGTIRWHTMAAVKPPWGKMLTYCSMGQQADILLQLSSRIMGQHTSILSSSNIMGQHAEVFCNRQICSWDNVLTQHCSCLVTWGNTDMLLQLSTNMMGQDTAIQWELYHAVHCHCHCFSLHCTWPCWCRNRGRKQAFQHSVTW